ncbi:MAG: hypothetical protein IPN01_02325 [Deltaproteobacteria bacterium]|nr:hypothetical protein [Deltaproteobacteria bacterium]
MSELRRCPIRGHHVILATDRLVTPNLRPPVNGGGDGCVLCVDGPARRWKVLGRRGACVVVPNGRPALKIEAQGGWQRVGPYERREGLGAHEVIVESDEHGRTPWQQTPAELADVLSLARERLIDLRRDPRLKNLSWIKVHRAEAGARVDHPHSQVIALPEPGPLAAREVEAHERYAQENHGRSLSQDLIQHELQDGARLIQTDALFVSLVPFAPWTAFECWIWPRVGGPAFESTDDDDSLALASHLCGLLSRLHTALGDAPLQIVLRTEPSCATFRWRLELRPVIENPRALTLATGCAEQAVPPEEVAAFLRGL